MKTNNNEMKRKQPKIIIAINNNINNINNNNDNNENINEK
jgi:hypothetical protein